MSDQQRTATKRYRTDCGGGGLCAEHGRYCDGCAERDAEGERAKNGSEAP